MVGLVFPAHIGHHSNSPRSPQIDDHIHWHRSVKRSSKARVVLLFPEGTRGQPRKAPTVASRDCALGEASPDVDIVPIFLHGLGKALPRGEGLLVPSYATCSSVSLCVGQVTKPVSSMACCQPSTNLEIDANKPAFIDEPMLRSGPRSSR